MARQESAAPAGRPLRRDALALAPFREWALTYTPPHVLHRHCVPSSTFALWRRIILWYPAERLTSQLSVALLSWGPLFSLTHNFFIDSLGNSHDVPQLCSSPSPLLSTPHPCSISLQKKIRKRMKTKKQNKQAKIPFFFFIPFVLFYFFVLTVVAVLELTW